jgi:hypothetical protein
MLTSWPLWSPERCHPWEEVPEWWREGYWRSGCKYKIQIGRRGGIHALVSCWCARPLKLTEIVCGNTRRVIHTRTSNFGTIIFKQLYNKLLAVKKKTVLPNFLGKLCNCKLSANSNVIGRKNIHDPQTKNTEQNECICVTVPHMTICVFIISIPQTHKNPANTVLNPAQKNTCTRYYTWIKVANMYESQ